MKRNDIETILNGIDNKYILEALELSPENDTAPPPQKLHKISRIIIFAAVITVMLVFSAFAGEFFSMDGRVGESTDDYELEWETEDSSGSITISDIKYVFEFAGAEECHAIKFRPGWLPFEPNDIINPKLDGGFYSSRLVSELTPEASVDRFNYQPYMVTVFYSPFFVNGGQMLLHYQAPGEITKEEFGDITTYKFTAHQKQQGYENDFYFDIIFNEAEGYIVVVSGTSDMETIEHIANELEIVQTDEIIRSEDYIDYHTFIDVGVG